MGEVKALTRLCGSAGSSECFLLASHSTSAIKSILLVGEGKALARLCGCACSSQPSLLAAAIRSLISCAGASVELDNRHSAEDSTCSMFSSTINIQLISSQGESDHLALSYLHNVKMRKAFQTDHFAHKLCALRHV